MPEVQNRGEASLLEALRQHTQTLHTEAERSGIVRKLLRGTATRYGHALFLRNLLPAYRQLERELDRLPAGSVPEIIASNCLHRSEAIRSDLEALYGGSWDVSLPLLPSGSLYASQILKAAQGNGKSLLAWPGFEKVLHG